MKLNDLEFIKLLPQFMQEDATDQGLAEAVSYVLSEVFDDTDTLRIWDMTMSLNEKQCDELAWELDIAWYDSVADLDVKRQVLYDAISVKKKLGTVSAITNVISAYFESGYVSEWQEFDGQPFTFSVMTENEAVTSEQFEKMTARITQSKNVRSRLAGIFYLWRQGYDSAVIASYLDAMHRYSIKKCGITPRIATLGFSAKSGIVEENTQLTTGYDIRAVQSDACGTIGAYRGTAGTTDSASIKAANIAEITGYGYTRSGTKICSFSVGSASRSEIEETADAVIASYSIKKCSFSLGMTAKSDVSESADASALSYSIRRCGIYRCRA